MIDSGDSLVLQNVEQPVQEIQVPGDGVICAIMTKDRISIYDLVKQCLFYSFPQTLTDGQEAPFYGNCLSFGNKAGRLMLGTQHGNVDFLDLRQKNVTTQIKASDFSIEQVSVHPFDNFMIVGDSQGCLKVKPGQLSQMSRF